MAKATSPGSYSITDVWNNSAKCVKVFSRFLRIMWICCPLQYLESAMKHTQLVSYLVAVTTVAAFIRNVPCRVRMTPL
jgi:hypothetical protein